MHATALLLCCLVWPQFSLAARILAVIPIPSYSHQIPYRALWTALAKRGHQVIVLTTDPVNDPNLNFTEIDFHHNYEEFLSLDFSQAKYKSSWLEMYRAKFFDIGDRITENIYKHPEVWKLYQSASDQSFDLVIAEVLLTPGIYALAHRFDAPLIGVSSLGLQNSNYFQLGAPVLPSHPSNWEVEERTGDNLSFYQRLCNFLAVWKHLYYFYNEYIPRQQIIAEKYLGTNIPHISDIAANISLILMNQQEAISFSRPLTSNVLSFGGFHVSQKLNPLPPDLAKFLDDSHDGFIYVSLGTNARFELLPKILLRIFERTFAKLSVRVVWKCDVDIPNKPDNIYVSKWLPQQSILAHPNIRLFVYQGGLQSTEEAVSYAVPLVGIPVLADQEHQVKKMVELGVAKRVSLVEITFEALHEAIIDVLNDSRYKERMVNLSEFIKDKPYDTLSNAVWWSEFIIRHKGAPHLRCSISNQPWYKRYDMDIVAFISILTFVTFLLSCLLIYKICVEGSHRKKHRKRKEN
ncbi:UDP-glucosyltransferase 2-like [Prorops nasuta]|uniref:UDP-glucosyltransferase 2-like n=1 Tax=Prorops nasuta TaxID=863751 RepID=UPI0034CD8FF5